MIKYNVSLKPYNTFGIDVSCKRFVEYHTASELKDVLQMLQDENETKIFHIGGGSNLLFTNNFEGTILHSAIRGLEVVEEDAEKALVRAGAGEPWDEFVAFCVRKGFHGLENLSLIPGEVGASAVQNIGAYGVEAGQFIAQVHLVDVATREECTKSVAECGYTYRSSVFKKECRGKYIVTHVDYRLDKRFVPVLSHSAIVKALAQEGIEAEHATAQQMRAAIIRVREEKLPDPKLIGSAGSFFMNPVVSTNQAEFLLQKYPEMPHYKAESGVKIPAAWLIEQTGWKGKQYGKAGVHSKQALVIVNVHGATGQEIVELSRMIQKDVFAKFGIAIHPEVNFVE